MITKDNIREKLIEAGFKDVRYDSDYPGDFYLQKLDYCIYITLPELSQLLKNFTYDADYCSEQRDYNPEAIFTYNFDEFVAFLANRGIVLEDKHE